MYRRRYLAALGAGVLGTALAGCNALQSNNPSDENRTETATTASGTERDTGAKPETREFETTLDAVADLGCDPRGNESCGETITNAVSRGTMIEFPPGEYLVTDPILLWNAVEFGVRGTGEHRNDVRFVHPEGYSDFLFNVRDGRDCLFENFTAEQTNDRRTNSGLVLLQRDGLLVRDVEISGFTPTDGGTQGARIQILDPSGVGTVKRMVNRGGGEVGVYPASHAGFYSGVQHRGTLHLVNCHFEECPSNAVYASRTHGPIKVKGGVFKNNAVSQIRISGDGSLIKNAKVVIDTDSASRVQGTYNAVRGVWWESGPRGKTGGQIENCEFRADSAQLERGLIEIDGTAGSMTVRNCSFDIDRNGFWAFKALPPGVSSMGGKPARPWNLTLENLTIRDRAADGVAVQITGRPRSRISGVTIDHERGANRDGLCLARCHDTTVLDTEITTSRYPLWVYTPGDSDSCPLHLGRTTRLVSTTGAVESDRLLSTRDTRTDCDSGCDAKVCIGRDRDGDAALALSGTAANRFFGQRLARVPDYLEFARQ